MTFKILLPSSGLLQISDRFHLKGSFKFSLVHSQFSKKVHVFWCHAVSFVPPRCFRNLRVKYSSFFIRNFEIVFGWGFMLRGSFNLCSFLHRYGFHFAPARSSTAKANAMSWPAKTTQKSNLKISRFLFKSCNSSDRCDQNVFLFISCFFSFLLVFKPLFVCCFSAPVFLRLFYAFNKNILFFCLFDSFNYFWGNTELRKILEILGYFSLKLGLCVCFLTG